MASELEVVDMTVSIAVTPTDAALDVAGVNSSAAIEVPADWYYVAPTFTYELVLMGLV